MPEVKELVKILNKISSESGRLKKEAFLIENKDNQLLIETLKFLHDPAIVANLAYKKVNKDVSTPPKDKILTYIDLLDYVVKSSGKDAEIASIQDFIYNYPNEATELKQIVTKSYKTGFSAKTLNKIFGDNFIFVLELQLAETYKEDDLKKFPEGTIFTITTKFDGHRNTFSPSMKKYLTRSGKLNEGLTEIEKSASQILEYLKDKYGKDFYLDGEIMIENTDKPKSEWFNETTKLLGAKKENKTNLKYILFDLCPQKEFEIDKVSKDTYSTRRSILEDALNALNLPHVELAEALYVGTDKSKIMEFYTKAVNDGEEGIMVNLEAPYYCKRTHTLLKVKPVNSADLEIIGFEEGAPETKYVGMLGSLIVNYKGTPVHVGSGLTDPMRKEIWENQTDYLGKIAEVIYTTESTNQVDDSIKLRFPRFKQIRYDKTVDDVNFE